MNDEESETEKRARKKICDKKENIGVEMDNDYR